MFLLMLVWQLSFSNIRYFDENKIAVVSASCREFLAMTDQKLLIPSFDKITRLRVPCDLIIVDSPKRANLLKEGLQIRSTNDILGNGSFGIVVKAMYKGKQVAMKIIDNLNAEKKATVENEANILGWDHRNLIKILKIDSGPRQSVIIMERFPGQCLQHVLDRVKISFYHILRICLDISDALFYCHERNLVHLDVKPKNVLIAFLSNDGSSDISGYDCKLCDFGSSIFLNNNVRQISARGTIRYMAPEILQSLEVSERSDIYSFGITMWQLKAGKDPYFWLMDNETVAYNVIKNNLRPDSNPLADKVESFLSPRQTDCFCQHFSSNKIHRSIKRAPRGNVWRRSASPLPSATDYQKRIAFRNLNNSFNPLANDGFRRTPTKLQQLKPCEIRINGGNFDDDTQLQRIFTEKVSAKKREAEIEYQKLYKNCWDAVSSQRPTSKTVQNTLKDILKCF